MGAEEAACVATCPMHTDAKEYIRLIRDGKGEESIKVIREKLFIPGTLGRICAHPCETQCKWNEGKSPMAIASLKRYAADNFDKEENWDLTPTFDENDVYEIEVDTIVFAIGQGIEGSFANGKLEQRRNSTFECDKLTLQSLTNEKVFIAGDASGESVIVIQAMATGRRAAQSVIRFLKGEDLVEGRVLEDTWTFKTKLDMPTNWDEVSGKREDMQELLVEERITNFDEVALGYTKEEAMREADKCRQCVCKKCMKECIMLNDYTDCPKTLFKKYLDNGYENMDKMIAFSCNECNQCTLVCPKSLELAPNFIAIKEKYNEDNNDENVIDSLKPFDKSQDMECSEEYSTTVLAKEKKTKYLFVPGCTVPAYSPGLIEKTLAHLRDTLDGEVGAMLQCCGKVTKLIGEPVKFKERNKKAVEEINETNADVIITICPSCYNVYSSTTDKKVISYWDLMKESIGIPENQKNIGLDSDVIFNIHDSCVTRNVSSHHESVRWIIEELGYKYSEIERSKGNTRCCGVGEWFVAQTLNYTKKYIIEELEILILNILYLIVVLVDEQWKLQVRIPFIY